MMTDDREAYNALSAVLVNRPKAIREVDQIYMRAGDMLAHVRSMGQALQGRRLAFIGDGDAVALALAFLTARGILDKGPATCTLFDFDERIVESVRAFARSHDIEDRIQAFSYNVAHPFPSDHLGRYDGFHTNPPFGQRNEGKSMRAFLDRCIEACSGDVLGCLVAADDATAPWTAQVISASQRHMANHGFRVAQMIPACHRYHLDDAPDLTSASIVFASDELLDPADLSLPIPDDWIKDFYGREQPLNIQRITDHTEGARYPSRDYTIEPFKHEHRSNHD